MFPECRSCRFRTYGMCTLIGTQVEDDSLCMMWTQRKVEELIKERVEELENEKDE